MAAADRKSGLYADYAIGTSTVTLTAPTVAEINALTRLECGLVDGFDLPREGSTIDISGLCDSSSRKQRGPSDNGDGSAEAYREFDGTDAYWAACDDDPTVGTQTLVRCPAGFSGAGDPAIAATGDLVDLYTVEVIARSPMQETRSDAQRFRVEVAVIDVVFGVAVVA